MYIVYCAENLINNKRYIGITKRRLKDRIIGHKSCAYNPNSHSYNTPFKQAIRKYSLENFSFTVLETVNTVEEANEREKFYIKKFNTYCYQKESLGYNATLGGEGVSVKTKKIVSIDSKSGEIINVYKSVEEAEQILNIGHIRDCLNNRLLTSGGVCWDYYENYINKNKEEQKDFIYSKFNYILQFNISGELINAYPTLKEAERANNLNAENIIKCCKGRAKTLNKCIWRYYLDYKNNGLDRDKIYYKPTIVQKDLNGKLIKTFNTLKEAVLFN